MPLDINSASARVTRNLCSTEDSIDTALVEATALLHSAAIARRDISGVGGATAQGAMIRLSKIVSSLVDVQGDAKRAHAQLLGIAHELGATEQPGCPDYIVTTGDHKQAAA